MNTQRYCTFYIVRHGETEWNVNGLLQGQEDSPLTQKGISQATELGKELQHIHFDEVFSSDLLRAKRTAEIITLERKLAVKTTELLRERRFGKYEGKHGLDSEVKEMFEKFYTLPDREKMSYDNPEVENDNSLISRFITVLREIAVGYPGKTILVVTHGGMIRALLLHLGFGSYDELRHNAIQNCAYLKLESDGIDFFIKETSNIIKRNI